MDATMLKAHLGDELFAQVAAKLNPIEGLSIIATNDGSWIPKARFDEERGKVKTLTADLEKAKTAGADMDTYKARITALEKDVADRDATITSIRQESKLLDMARGVKAKNPELVVRMLDRSKIGTNDKGELTGVNEQFDSIKQQAAYMFESENGGQQGGFGGGRHQSGAGSDGAKDHSSINNAIRAAAGRG